MLTNIKNKSISLILLNARINKKSFKKWTKLISGKTLFNKFDLCLSSSNESKINLVLLQNVKNILEI